MRATADAVAEAAARSPLSHGPGLSELADRDELDYRERHEA